METDLFAQHKPIRNKIKNYNAIALVNLAIDVLHKIEDNYTENNNGYIPWEIMLVIRWALQYAEPNIAPKEPSIYDLHDIINAIKGIHSSIKLPYQKEHYIVHKFLRRIASQQFPYHVNITEIPLSMGRQLILFNDMAEKYKFNDQLQKETGLSVLELLMVAFSVFTILHSGKKRIFQIESFTHVLPRKNVEDFFNLLSLNDTEAKKFLVNDAKSKSKKDFAIQLYEFSPLVRYPFLRHNGLYYNYSKKLFLNTFSHFIYDFLKQNNSHFMRDFGDVFEKYIGERLDWLNLLPIKGADLPGFFVPNLARESCSIS